MRFLLTSLLVLSFFTLTLDAQTRPRKRKAPTVPVFKIAREAPPAPPPPKALPTFQGATVESWISDYNLNADGTGTETRSTQQRCATELCVKRLETYTQVYNADLQKSKVLDAYIAKADGTQVKVPATAIVDRPTDQTEAAPGFSSMRQTEVKFEGLKIGDAAYVKVETTTTRPTFDGRFDSLETFSALFDWKAIEINVSAPSSFPLYVEAVGLDGGKLADENGRSRWQYKKQNLQKIAIEPAMYDVTTISPRFAITAFPDANALGSVFWEAVKSKAIVTPDIQTLANEITKDAKTPSEQAAAIYEWVNKNIRYLFIVMDRGGWVPHSSTEIIRNGYGDCKDYTTIIHTLLKAKGIESSPVLIRSDFGDWFPAVPTADYFNHAILFIPSLNVFADATIPNTRLGMVPQTLVGKRAILAGEKTGIIQLPRDNPLDNQLLSEMKMDFADNGSVTTRTKNTYVGRAEMIFRPLFTGQVKSDGPMFVKMMLAYFGLDGEGDFVSVSDPHKVGEPFAVELESRIANFTTFIPKGKLQIPPGLNFMSLASLEQLTTTESRKTNIAVGASKAREVLVINLPARVKVVTPPAASSFTNTLGSFTVKPELKDGTVTYIRELIIGKDVVEPKDYPLLKELIKHVSEAGTIEVEYSADSSLLQAKSKELRTVHGKPSATGKAPSQWWDPRRLSPAEIRKMEAKVKADPNDVETRVALIRHYAVFDHGIGNQNESKYIQHRLWLINNRPEMGDKDVYGYAKQKLSASSIELIKNAWLGKVAEAKSSNSIRLNAIESLKPNLPAAASTLAEEGAELDPADYRFSFLVAEINADRLEKEPMHAEAEVSARKVVDFGKRSLAAIKKERSSERDNDREDLLQYLCSASLRLGDLDGAESYARELVVNFGQTSSSSTYDEAAHVGNTTLGLVALRRGDVEKAKQHLMASVLAPLRKDYTFLTKVDMRLAAELYDRGQKTVVAEYLKRCLELGNFKTYPESYADEIKALKLWQDQIAKGIRPSFDFKKL